MILEKPVHHFDHDRLDAFRVAREALRLGDAIVRDLPRGYGSLGDQLRRALLAQYLQTSEAASRSGADRLNRFRMARAEAGEAAAALLAVGDLGLADRNRTDEVIELLWRVCAMLHRLSRPTR